MTTTRERALEAALKEIAALTLESITRHKARAALALPSSQPETPPVAAGEHTPGPWRSNSIYVEGPRPPGTFKTSVADIATCHTCEDARLIAAAPDMLAFCKRVAATKPVLATEAELLKGWLAMIAEARAAIARATGRD